MRIVELVPSLEVGGAERMAALMALGLGDAGHEVHVVSLYDPVGSWIEAELRPRVPVVHLGKRPGLDPRILLPLRRVVRELRPDVVHTHLHALKYALAAVPPRKLVHTLHNLAEHEMEGPTRRLHAIAFRLGVTPVAIGAAVAASIRRVYGFDPRHVIPNGIPLAACRAAPEARAQVRAELGLGDGPVFLSVGRLNRQKNHAGLIRAFAQVPGAHLLIAGEGELRAELEAATGPRVRLLGARKDVPRLLAAADVFVLASRWEGNPLVVMEAMAAGRPVVATAVGCVPELVEADGLVPPGDEGALAAAMRRAMVDPGPAGERARAVADARFDARLMVDRYAELFGKIGAGTVA